MWPVLFCDRIHVTSSRVTRGQKKREGLSAVIDGSFFCGMRPRTLTQINRMMLKFFHFPEITGCTSSSRRVLQGKRKMDGEFNGSFSVSELIIEVLSEQRRWWVTVMWKYDTTLVTVTTLSLWEMGLKKKMEMMSWQFLQRFQLNCLYEPWSDQMQVWILEVQEGRDVFDMCKRKRRGKTWRWWR